MRQRPVQHKTVLSSAVQCQANNYVWQQGRGIIDGIQAFVPWNKAFSTHLSDVDFGEWQHALRSLLADGCTAVSSNQSPCFWPTSSSAMAERPCEIGDFKGVSHFEVKF